MKKLAVLAVAAMLVFSLAGQAAAYFEDLNLIRTIYEPTLTVEVGSDLGPNVSTFAVAPYVVGGNPVTGFAPVPPTTPVNEFRGDLVALSSFSAGLSGLKIAYYSRDKVAQDFYATGWLTTAYGGTDNDGLSMAASKQTVGDAIFNNVQGYYDDFGTATVIAAQANTNSYWQNFDKNGVAVGSMGQTLVSPSSYEMEVSLADLAATGYVDQLLYYFDYNNTRSTKPGVEVAVIRTFLTSDGTTIDLGGDKIATVINPSAVPIPGSVLLLASGLLGLFGFRRKKG